MPSPRTEVARALRQAQTTSEGLLWAQLRDRRLAGYKFVRQSPIGPFVADFVCRREKLVVEVDGPTHFETAAKDRDARRTAYLRRNGYHILRVTNDDVRTRLEQVREVIYHSLQGNRPG